MTAGPTLELGAGPGLMTSDDPHWIAVDLTAAPKITVQADAHALPFAGGHFTNIVAVDVLHHLARPESALTEATRILARSGRLILIEPWAGTLGWLFYRHVHHESCARVDDPWRQALPPDKDPMAGNAWIPKAVLADQANRWPDHAVGFKLIHCEVFGALAYLATGGFQRWGAPRAIIKALIYMEKCLPQWLMRHVGLRALFVLETPPAKGLRRRERA